MWDCPTYKWDCPTYKWDCPTYTWDCPTYKWDCPTYKWDCPTLHLVLRYNIAVNKDSAKLCQESSKLTHSWNKLICSFT